MKVIKRDGRAVEYNSEKISVGVINEGNFDITCSFIGENRTINSSLHLLLTKSLVKHEIVDSKTQYNLTKLGEIFIDSIDTKYMICLRESVKWVCSFFRDYTAEELNSFVQTHVENWNLE